MRTLLLLSVVVCLGCGALRHDLPKKQLASMAQLEPGWYFRLTAATNAAPGSLRRAADILEKRIVSAGLPVSGMYSIDGSAVFFSSGEVPDPEDTCLILGKRGVLDFHLVDEETFGLFIKTYGNKNGPRLNLSFFTNCSDNPRYVDWRIASRESVPRDFPVPDASSFYYFANLSGQSKGGTFLHRRALMSDIRFTEAFPAEGRNKSLDVNAQLAPLFVGPFQNITRTNASKLMAVVLDGEIIMSPRIHGEITGGRVLIGLAAEKKEVVLLAAIMSHGPLPEGTRLERYQR